MKKRPEPRNGRDMLPEYDFRGGVRGKYARRIANGTTMVLLDADVARDFPDADAVNTALRTYRRILRAIPTTGAK